MPNPAHSNFFAKKAALSAVSLLALAVTHGAARAEITVMASIKPIHSLVAGVMEGVGQPELIVQGSASPHTYSLKPSQAEALQNANLVFWVGHELEAFLEKPLETIATKANAVSLLDTQGITVFPPRETGNFEGHDHGAEASGHSHGEGHEHAAEGEHDHAHGKTENAEAGHDHGHAHEEGEEVDAHVWLDPQNAILMTEAIEAALTKADPENAAAYAANADKQIEKLNTLQNEIAAELKPTQGKGFIVFHDAYQYFEKRFGITVLGSVTMSPEVTPGADRLSELREKVTSLKASCIFAEPNFEPKLVNAIIEGTPAKMGTLDPEASGLSEGPSLYFDMMRGISSSISTCLTEAS
jgi:zinc transport system substrate-binding protein